MHIPNGDGGRDIEPGKPRRTDFDDNLGGAVAYCFAYVGYWVLDACGEFISAVLAKALEFFNDMVAPSMIRAFRPMLERTRDDPNCTPELKAMINEALTPGHVAPLAVMGIIGSVVGFGTTLASLWGYMDEWRMKVNRRMRLARPPVGDAWAMFYRDTPAGAKVRDFLADQGWSDDLISAYAEIARPRIDTGSLVAYYLRKFKTPERAREELEARGYPPDDVSQMLELAEVIPGVGDLITMGVREAWRDDVARKYGYDEDYPGELTEWAAKQGLSEDWCTRYWRAHWELPGPTMAREMLWRTSMTKEDYATLLRIADFPRTFRGWMTEIAYTPWTRVDVRRMHKLGIIPDRAGLEWAYEQIGYTGKQLDGIVDFTIAYNQEDERTACKTDILAAYDIGRFSRSEAKEALVSIGYLEWAAEVSLARADLKKATRIAKEKIKHIKTLYIGGRLNKSEATTRLANIPIPTSEIDALFEEWDIRLEAKVGRPSKSELRRFFLQNILDEGTLRTELAGHQLSDAYIDLYVEDAKLHLKENMEKEAERARKEQERIRKAKIKTKADIQLADLVVAVAEANVAIADIKLAKVKDMPAPEVVKANELILEYKVLIAQLYAKMAEVRKEYVAQIAKEV